LSVERFVAARYLLGRGRADGSRPVVVLTGIAAAGVAVGVAALIVVIGVLQGLQTSLRDRILAGGPDAHVVQLDNEFALDDWQGVIDVVQRDEAVLAASPVVITDAILRAGDQYNQTVMLRGIAPGEEADQMSGLRESLQTGGGPYSETESGDPGVVVGVGLSRSLGLRTGSSVVVASLQNAPLSHFGFSPALARFEVTGIFETGLYQYDDQLALVPVVDAQRLTGLGTSVTAVELDAVDPWEVEALAERLRDRLGFPYHIDTWQDLNGSLFSALRLEKFGMGVVLTLIVIVASFNIASTLVMLAADRTGEVGILRATGFTTKSVSRVFRWAGLCIGAAGTLAGLALGGAAAWTLGRYEIISLPSDVYFLDRLPVSVSGWDVAWIVTGSMLISWVSTIYPARRAARMNPIDAIRHE